MAVTHFQKTFLRKQGTQNSLLAFLFALLLFILVWKATVQKAGPRAHVPEKGGVTHTFPKYMVGHAWPIPCL